MMTQEEFRGGAGARFYKNGVQRLRDETLYCLLKLTDRRG